MGHSEDDAVHKIPHKNKTHRQNQLKIQYWFDLNSSIELNIKRLMSYLSNAPLIFFEKIKSFISLLLCDAGDGEQGVGVKLTAEMKKTEREDTKANGFNVRVSDMVSLDRAIPDIRNAR